MALTDDIWALAYEEGYAVGVALHLEHHRCERCYAAGQAEAEARLAALTAALAQIKARPDQVCAEFELCTHPVCASSYAAFAIADAALDAAGET